MIPLEPGDSTQTTGTEKSKGSEAPCKTSEYGASAPIALLSKFAFKDAIHELEATTHRMRDAAFAASKQVLVSAEKKLGFEVVISDPAHRELFGVHVLGVEELCARVRAQADLTLLAAENFGHAQLDATAAWLRPLDIVAGSEDDIKALERELLDADREATSSRKLLESRMQEEVFDVLDQRLAQHEKLREDVRERQRWEAISERHKKHVAQLAKSEKSSTGLLNFSAKTSSAEHDEASGQMAIAMSKVSDIDAKILHALFELEASSLEAVRGPWASLLQIQSEFFVSQQTTWQVLGGAFQELADDGFGDDDSKEFSQHDST